MAISLAVLIPDQMVHQPGLPSFSSTGTVTSDSAKEPSSLPDKRSKDPIQLLDSECWVHEGWPLCDNMGTRKLNDGFPDDPLQA
jgi:hypothetical protein